MAAIADADLTGIFDDWDDATFTPSGGSAASIQGVFSRSYLAAEAGEGPAIDDRAPAFIGRTTDLAAAAQGDALTVSGSDYLVTAVEHNGNGTTMLRLGT